jgi:hypothetical protein
LNTGAIAASFHADGKCCGVRLQLNTYLRTGTKIPEQPFVINPGVSLNPTVSEGFRLFMALRTSSSETRARAKNSED